MCLFRIWADWRNRDKVRQETRRNVLMWECCSGVDGGVKHGLMEQQCQNWHCDNSNVDDYLIRTVICLVSVIDLTNFCVCLLTDLKPV